MVDKRGRERNLSKNRHLRSEQKSIKIELKEKEFRSTIQEEDIADKICTKLHREGRLCGCRGEGSIVIHVTHNR